MEIPPLPGADESLPVDNEITLWESSDDSGVEVIKELKTNLEAHECELCCEGKFLVNRLLQFGGVINANTKFVCEICDKGFKWKSSLSNHVKKHLNLSKQYNDSPKNRSSNISKGLNDSNTLNSSTNSSATNSPSASFICNICSSKYKNKGSLHRHKRNKHSNQAFVCEVCHAKYSDFSQFTTHCSSHSKLSKSHHVSL